MRLAHVCVYMFQPEVAFDDPNSRNLVEEVSLKEVRVFNPGMDVSIIAFDCGMKANIIRYTYICTHGTTKVRGNF